VSTSLADSTLETTESTSAVPVVPVVPPTVVQSTTQRSVDPNGVVTDHTKTVTQGTTMSPYGDTTTTRRTTDTTTVR
jgi:hypothetical protein